MSPSASSFPQPGSQGHVTLNGHQFILDPGSYSVEDAKRFGDKISIGAIKYDDFNVYENAHTVITFRGGYGLRRYSDFDDENQGIQMYLETDGVDCSTGIAILNPLWYGESLPGNAHAVYWLGEFTPSTGALAGVRKWVAVGNTGAFNGVWYRNTDGSWTLTAVGLAAAPLRGAIGVFNGKLIIGYGATQPAHFTTDLATITTVKDELSNTLAISAFVADRSAAYIAAWKSGDPHNLVTSSLDGGINYTLSAVPCSTPDAEITGLSPSGGNGIVFVGSDRELGVIGSDGIYRTLIPFDSILATNCRGMRWWMGRGGDEQRGASLIVFPRDHSLWAYEPNGENSGRSQNISPWAQPAIRPLNARGITYASQGSARWLYYTVQNASGEVWVIRRDAITGASHTWFKVPSALSGGQSCFAMGITSLFGTRPLLFMGQGANLTVIKLPLDGENPLDDSEMRYCASGTLTLPAIDIGFPDELKNLFAVRIVADNLITGGRRVKVEVKVDNATSWTNLGYVETSPSGEVFFPDNTSGKRVQIRLTLSTTDPTETPQVLGISVRTSINPKMYRIWGFTAVMPNVSIPETGRDVQDPNTIIDELWNVVREGTVVDFTDRWNRTYKVRVLHMKEGEVRRAPERPPTSVLTFQLLEVRNFTGESRYNNALAVYDSEQTHYGE